MSFPIDTAVPTTGHNPSQDYVAMQQNYANINLWGAVDHVGYGVSANAGQHLQVTIPTPLSGSPTLTGTQGMFYTLSNGGVANAYFANADGASLLVGNSSAVSNGYVQVAGGIYFQWGSASYTSGTFTVDFPIAFPNNCFQVLITSTNANAAAAGRYVTSVTTTNFVIASNFTLLSGSSFSFFAIGN